MDLMNRICSPYLDKFVLIFIDDILVYSKDEVEHVEHLRVVLETFRHEQLHAKLSKYEFSLKSIAFLGHVVSKEGISVNPSKIQVVKDRPIPESAKEIKSIID